MKCSLLCRIGVERDWEKIREEVCREEVNESLLMYQSYHSSYLSIVLSDLFSSVL